MNFTPDQIKHLYLTKQLLNRLKVNDNVFVGEETVEEIEKIFITFKIKYAKKSTNVAEKNIYEFRVVK